MAGSAGWVRPGSSRVHVAEADAAATFERSAPLRIFPNTRSTSAKLTGSRLSSASFESSTIAGSGWVRVKGFLLLFLSTVKGLDCARILCAHNAIGGHRIEYSRHANELEFRATHCPYSPHCHSHAHCVASQTDVGNLGALAYFLRPRFIRGPSVAPIKNSSRFRPCCS